MMLSDDVNGMRVLFSPHLEIYLIHQLVRNVFGAVKKGATSVVFQWIIAG